MNTGLDLVESHEVPGLLRWFNDSIGDNVPKIYRLAELPPYPSNSMPMTEITISIDKEKLGTLLPNIDVESRCKTCPIAQEIQKLLIDPWVVSVSSTWYSFQYKYSQELLECNGVSNLCNAIPALILDCNVPMRSWLTSLDAHTGYGTSVDDFKKADFIEKVYEYTGFLNASMFIPSHILKPFEQRVEEGIVCPPLIA
jgi:hypothetical protein